jgi:serine phosphatase RsbU (regulator of sigma subunit)
MSADFLHRIPLFASLPADEITRVAGALQAGRYDAGEILFLEGDAGNRFYLIVEGQLEVVKALGTPDERVIAVRGAGDYVGEMSLILVDGKRTASIRARTALRTLEMTRADFDALLHRQPQMAYQMARVLSTHLSEAHTFALDDMRAKNRELSIAYESLQAAQIHIIQKEKLEHELRMARSVQAGLLPRTVPALDGWQFAARWRPARIVSGDFYDFIALNDGTLGMVIADVSDKGMPAALFMSLSRSILRACATSAAALEDAVRRANVLICADSVDSMFVTLFVCALNPITGALTYVNAGHNPPLLFRAAGAQWQELKSSGMALGVTDEAHFVQHAAQLDAGDVLVLYTDGVSDALDLQDERFGRERLTAVLHDAQDEDTDSIADALERALESFTAGGDPYDDMTYVVVKRV